MKVNRVIKFLILSDFMAVSGYAVFGPIFAVYITKQVSDGSLAVVGFATAIVQIVKSIFQIPIAHYLDTNHGEIDDFYSMVLGGILVTSTIFLYLFVEKPWHLYLVQAIYGLGLAFSIPPWYAIFTRHIDKLKMNVEWSMDSVSIGLGSAMAASLGGVIAEKFGFSWTFILGGVVFALGTVAQIFIYKDLKKEVGHNQVLPNK